MNSREEKSESLFCDAKKYLLDNMDEVLSQYEGITEMKQTVESLLAAQQIFIYGVGRSGLVGRAFAMRLVQLGLKCYFIGESTTPIVTPKDLVIVISRTGETYSALQTANIVRRLGTKLIVVTSKKGAKLAHAGNIVHYLVSGNDEQRTKLAPLGTLFELSAFLLFDCIVAELMARMGESEDTMKARHAIWV